MSLTSGYRVDAASRPVACITSFLEAGVFCVLSVVFVLGALLLCTAMSVAASGKGLLVSTSIGAWMGHAGALAQVVAAIGLLWLVIVYWLPGATRIEASSGAAGIVGLVVKSLVFVLIAMAYFVGVTVLWLAVGGVDAKAAKAGIDVSGMTSAAPVWGYALTFVAYLVLVTVYFAPGEAESNKAELLGFTLFLAAAMIVGGTVLTMTWLSKLPFWKDFFANIFKIASR